MFFAIFSKKYLNIDFIDCIEVNRNSKFNKNLISDYQKDPK